MKKLYALMALLVCSFATKAQSQVCNPNGNLIIYSNYDGGTLNIDIDQNIPNLKIGIVAYEALSINISGTFVSNVTGVIFAGYPSNGNTTCGTSGPSGQTTISGVSSSITSLQFNPQATLPNSNGNSSIVCAYSCQNNTSQGGCNTVDQVVDYFETQFPGSTLRYHMVQYNCWLNSEIRSVSQGGNCCLLPPAAPAADFTISTDTICEGECVNFSDISLNNPSSWSWVFQGGNPGTSNAQNPQNICFQNSGLYTINLTATNTTGSGSVNQTILVKPKPTFLTQPLSATSNPGSTHSFSTTLSGTNNQLQWQMNTGTGFSNLSNGGQFTGVNTNTLSVSNITMSNDNQQFRCIASLNGCSDTSEIAILNVLNNTGIKELIHAGVMISPNPASDLLHIKNDNAKKIALQILDLQGRTVLYRVIESGNNLVRIEHLNAGVYIIRMPEISDGFFRLIKE